MKRVLLIVLTVLATQAGAQDLFFGRPDSIPSELEGVYSKGLAFLVKAQAADGGWADSQYGSQIKQPGVAGLAVLAMLAHGDDPNTGPYAEPIRRGLGYILQNQQKGNGYIGASMYNHGFATLALAEAYGVVDDARLGPALEKAVLLILTSQANNPEKAWRYSPEANDADTTVSGACFVALIAARNAGLPIPEEALKKALGFYKKCALDGGGFGYMAKDYPSGPRNAIGVLAFALARQKEEKVFKDGVKALVNRNNGPIDGSYPFYFEYYMSQALFQADVKKWEEWNMANLRRLTSTQSNDGSWSGQHGQVFSTAAGLLSLALNYRFLPIYER